MISVRTIKRLFTGLLLVPALTFGAGKEIESKRTATTEQRLITVGGGVTEIIHALGLSDRIVATDVTSRIPPRVKHLPRVGYQRRLSAEGLLSLKPDHLIGTEEMGPAVVLSQLRKSGVKVTTLPAGTELSQLEERIRQLSDIAGKQKEGQVLWNKVNNDLALARKVFQDKKPKKVVFMMAHAGTSVLAGRNTTVNSLINMAGGVNQAADSFEGYRQVSGESLLIMAPDIIIVSESTLKKEKSMDGIMKLMPGLKATPAGRQGRIFIVDGSVLQGGLGPRIGEVALKLAKKIYETDAIAKY